MARELVDVTLRSWALRFLADPVKFIVTELFANATDETPGEDIWLLLSHEGGCLSIGVWDSSRTMPVPEAPDPYAESGRGLSLGQARQAAVGTAQRRRP